MSANNRYPRSTTPTPSNLVLHPTATTNPNPNPNLNSSSGPNVPSNSWSPPLPSQIRTLLPTRSQPTIIISPPNGPTIPPGLPPVSSTAQSQAQPQSTIRSSNQATYAPFYRHLADQPTASTASSSSTSSPGVGPATAPYQRPYRALAPRPAPAPSPNPPSNPSSSYYLAEAAAAAAATASRLPSTTHSSTQPSTSIPTIDLTNPQPEVFAPSNRTEVRSGLESPPPPPARRWSPGWELGVRPRSQNGGGRVSKGSSGHTHTRNRSSGGGSGSGGRSVSASGIASGSGIGNRSGNRSGNRNWNGEDSGAPLIGSGSGSGSGSTNPNPTQNININTALPNIIIPPMDPRFYAQHARPIAHGTYFPPLPPIPPLQIPPPLQQATPLPLRPPAPPQPPPPAPPNIPNPLVPVPYHHQPNIPNPPGPVPHQPPPPAAAPNQHPTNQNLLLPPSTFLTAPLPFTTATPFHSRQLHAQNMADPRIIGYVMSNAPAHILNAARATNRTDPDTGRLEPYARASVGQVPLRGEMIPDWEDTQPQARREGVVRRMIRVENERGEGRREREAMRKRERRRESGRGGEEWDEDEGERTLVGKRLVGYLLGNRVVERGEFVGRVGKRGVEGIEAGLVGKGFAGECFARGEDGEWEVCCGCCDEMVCGGEGEGRVKRKEGGWVLGGCCLLGAVCWECFEEGKGATLVSRGPGTQKKVWKCGQCDELLTFYPGFEGLLASSKSY
ncbi:hypothetical protein MMC10_001720 [Thelotrema lepadinum]|nr:hypothetical protein [Thelotrema lepadinum]